MKKIVLLAAVAALFVGMLAGPASAHAVSDAAVFKGTATLTPGLLLPPAGGTGTWEFTAPATWATTNTPGACVSVNHGSCSISVKGDLGPNAANVGASCGMSKGENGEGTYAGTHDVSNVGWETSAGGTIVLTSGDIDGVPIVGLVQAQGGAGCVSGGASTFNVVGVVAGVVI